MTAAAIPFASSSALRAMVSASASSSAAGRRMDSLGVESPVRQQLRRIVGNGRYAARCFGGGGSGDQVAGLSAGALRLQRGIDVAGQQFGHALRWLAFSCRPISRLLVSGVSPSRLALYGEEASIPCRWCAGALKILAGQLVSGHR